MGRLTPYIFFLLAVIAFGMIALEPDDSWQSDEVELLDAVLITGGVLIGAHVLRLAATKLYEGWKSRRQ